MICCNNVNGIALFLNNHQRAIEHVFEHLFKSKSILNAGESEIT